MSTKEEKKVDTAETEAETQEVEEETADAEGEESEAKNTDNTPDYKALLEEERQKRQDAEKALADRRFKISEKKREAEEVEDKDEDEDRPITRRELEEVVERTRSSTYKEVQAERIGEIAKGLAESDAEAELIVEIHKNRTFPAHLSMREQLEECHAIANRKRLVSKNAELRKALGSRDMASKDVANGHRDGAQGTAPKLSAQDAESYKRAGFTYDSKNRVYFKKLPSGKKLIKDPRSKKTYVA